MKLKNDENQAMNIFIVIKINLSSSHSYGLKQLLKDSSA